MGKRNLYLQTVSAEEATAKYEAALQGLLAPAYERIPVTEALHRVTKEAIYARFSSPLFNASAMDGIAVVAAHTEGASQTAPKVLTEGVDFVPVDTGDPVRAPYDAVIMAEDVVELESVGAQEAPAQVQITASAAPWQHIRPVGEDIVAGEMILPGRHKIRAIDIGVLLSAGIVEIEVYRRPRVAIFPTGDEIVEPEALLGDGAQAADAREQARDNAAEHRAVLGASSENGDATDNSRTNDGADRTPMSTSVVSPDPQKMIEAGAIIESNSRMFENMVTEAGGIGCRYTVIRDDYNTIRDTVAQAVQTHDMVIVNAGSSAGRDDYTVHVLRELGKVIVHGVAIKPGKPVILAIVSGKPVIGLPGYPVSAYIGFDLFVKPLVERLAGTKGQTALPAIPDENRRSTAENREQNAVEPQDPADSQNTAQAVISRRLVSSLKHREYVRVKVGRVDEKLIAAPLARGAGAAMSLVRADGFCVIPRESEGVEAGESVQIQLYRELQEIEHTAVIIGSHDLILDVISDLMTTACPGQFVSSTHVGSMGGLMALKRGECHIAPTHLLDEATGIYNVPVLQRMLGSAGAKKADAPQAAVGERAETAGPGQDGITLVKGVGRTQGIMVKKGNPLGIRGIADLARPKAGGSTDDAPAPAISPDGGTSDTSQAAGARPPVRFINRQRGAGTRVLFDYKLKQMGLTPADIEGYDREATTHMAVAAAVASDGCDAGMGILSAARAMDLDFIPIADEEYDFAIPTRFLQLPHVQAFLQVLTGDDFRARAEELGGYTFQCTGEQIEIWAADV